MAVREELVPGRPGLGADIMTALLKLAEGTRSLLEKIALASGWLLVVMAFVTTFDVIARKLGVRLPYTKLQELEWHFHAAIFSLWMGYCYTINAAIAARRGSSSSAASSSQCPTSRSLRTTVSISSRNPTGSASGPTARSA
jgi:hypothetical protein